ncbi:Acetyltransferase (isoleucine patch superfamily) [Filimonas lacunae]|uniref:Acetyltransferase (Isoleucine patch superfamily) n=1 Tax=Filimonas lacunae TaxID=477680 RepID=A0A173MHA9_9BACT|nr:acyltransferase [Filimonas lacunae]BAV06886.1 hypothetical protein FLA_2906 [Filimonas lacunae]SIS98364.1 Acetyltransferase (isoleucine patch superfamily) [Filimonas lacunae]
MKKWIEKLVQQRNPAFVFDKDMQAADILVFFSMQVKAWLRGCKVVGRGRNPKNIMLGCAVRFHYIRRIGWGRFVKLGDHVTLSALGRQGIQLGNNVGIGAFSRLVVATSCNNIGHAITIGNNVGIGEYAYLGGAGGLTIGDDCIVGQYFSCHPENHHCDDTAALIRNQGVSRRGIVIGRNCWIGSKVTILDGVAIGEGCVIAAGAVVNRSFPPDSIIGGVPARLLRKRGEKSVKDIAA